MKTLLIFLSFVSLSQERYETLESYLSNNENCYKISEKPRQYKYIQKMLNQISKPLREHFKITYPAPIPVICNHNNVSVHPSGTILKVGSQFLVQMNNNEARSIILHELAHAFNLDEPKVTQSSLNHYKKFVYYYKKRFSSYRSLTKKFIDNELQLESLPSLSAKKKQAAKLYLESKEYLEHPLFFSRFGFDISTTSSFHFNIEEKMGVNFGVLLDFIKEVKTFYPFSEISEKHILKTNNINLSSEIQSASEKMEIAENLKSDLKYFLPALVEFDKGFEKDVRRIHSIKNDLFSFGKVFSSIQSRLEKISKLKKIGLVSHEVLADIRTIHFEKILGYKKSYFSSALKNYYYIISHKKWSNTCSYKRKFQRNITSAAHLPLCERIRMIRSAEKVIFKN